MTAGGARLSRIFFVGLAAIAALGAQSPATSAGSMPAADSVLDARTAAVASTLRCPVCQGESIQDSPAELAQQMRAIVKEKLRNGETPQQIQGYFVARYGEWILLEPAVTGLNVLLYALPVVLVLGGLTLVFVLVRRWTAPEPVTNTAPATHSERSHD
jgi:cytochrome c-type biogenesis protein CcmH